MTTSLTANRTTLLRVACVAQAVVLAGLAGEAQEQRKPDFTSRVDLVTTDVVVRDKQGPVHRRPQERGLRGARGRRAADARVVLADPRRPDLQHRRAPPATVGRRPRPAAAAAGRSEQRAASSSSSSTTRTWTSATPPGSAICSSDLRASWFTKATCSGSSPPGPSVDRHQPDLRPPAAGRGRARSSSGGALTPGDIVTAPHGAQGPAEVRHRAHVAFSTAADVIRQLEQIHDRRKALIYISNGYDLDPFAKTRAKNEAERYGVAARQRRQQPTRAIPRSGSRATSSPSPISPASSPS